VAAARGLSGKWSSTGQAGAALWGLCKGSGAKPYQTVVDLSGPAYKCSCPSRKFPCKHALSLLLLWSAGTVPQDQEIALFAAEWIAGRRERGVAAAPKQADRAPSGAPPDPRTAQRRAERVSAGLDELDTWLCDQVRSGLASIDRSAAAFEAVAARMVDAQAPGVAATLRTLPGIVAGNPDWPERLLTEFAQLRLLVTAHRRVDELPEALGASVRRHVGYPVGADSVLAGPGVRDTWMVLAVTVVEEKRLYSRKVWLRGRRTGRWAMLLDFAHGKPAFTADVPPPGMLLEAELHYFPGAAPLRALLGSAHGTPEPFTTLRGDGLDEALATFADAVTADPWLRSWPVLLTGVVPVVGDKGGRCALVDEQGEALPLVDAGEPPWRLLGISGGHPVTVMGEWTHDGVAPLAVLSSGQMVPA
jgi:hypothetical protein